MIRISTAALGAAALLAVTAPVAVPHAALVSSSPAKGTRTATLPKVVTLTFSEALGRVGTVTIRRAGVNHTKRVRLNPRNRRQVQVFTRNARPGVYRVAWQVRAADGHRLGGTFGFSVRR